jgi:thiamine-monophosphate kinase
MPVPELQLINLIRRAAGKSGSTIGDDCAVLDLPRGHQFLVTTDFSLEGIHFRRELHPADSVGHRCLARGLSDIAAMGGTPRWAFLSLALPSHLPQTWVDKFVAGLLKLARQYNVRLAGGDTAQSPQGVLADIIVVGTVPRGRAILRSGAKPGDSLYVTGQLGVSVAALQELRAGKKLNPRKNLRHFYPDPRIAVGQFLNKNKLASAMIDTSDGLSTDLKHICEESRVGALVDEIFLPALPADTTFRNALHGGEDYELLFTVPRQLEKKLSRSRGRLQIVGVPVTRIGDITKDREIKIRLPDGHTCPLKPEGWQHFA